MNSPPNNNTLRISHDEIIVGTMEEIPGW